MTDNSKISRRTFVGSAISTAAVSSIPLQNLMSFSRQGASSPASSHWKDEGVLYVDKSPYAKLHSVPVHAVTITAGFWGARREINVDKSIPSMEQLLEGSVGGIVTLTHVGTASEKSDSGDKLYYRFSGSTTPVRPVVLKFIPYYAWANRAATPMQVWTPILRA